MTKNPRQDPMRPPSARLPDWRAMYVEAGYGLACDAEDPPSVAAALRWLLDHPREMRTMGERGRRRIAADWNYETQFASVLERLRKSTRSVGAAPVTIP